MKVAIFGAGRMGRNVLKHLQHSEGIEELVVCDPDENALAKAVEEFGAEPSTCEAALTDSAVRAVFIITPNHTHVPLALDAIAAGKAVMLEKPMGTTLEEATNLVNQAETRGAFLQIGFELRYSLAYTKVKEWIDAGLLGEVINTHCLYICSEFHGKGSWRNRIETCGGMFGEKLSHYVDIPRWFIGRPVETAYSACAPNIVTYKEVHDNYHTTCRFEGGAVSHLTFMMGPAAHWGGDPLQSAHDPATDHGHTLRTLVVGRSGTAEIDVFQRTVKLSILRDSPEKLTCSLIEKIQWAEDDSHFYIHNTTAQTRDIIRRVQAGLPPATSARDSLETMRLTLAAERSAESGNVERVNPS